MSTDEIRAFAKQSIENRPFLFSPEIANLLDELIVENNTSSSYLEKYLTDENESIGYISGGFGISDYEARSNIAIFLSELEAVTRQRGQSTVTTAAFIDVLRKLCPLPPICR